MVYKRDFHLLIFIFRMRVKRLLLSPSSDNRSENHTIISEFVLFENDNNIILKLVNKKIKYIV